MTPKITFKLNQKLPGNILNGSHIGATLDYAIGNLCDENKCTGSLNVMDNFPPILYCQTDTISCLDSFNPEFIGFPLDTSIIDTMYYIGENTYYLVGWDACADATLSYSDQVFQFFAQIMFSAFFIFYIKFNCSSRKNKFMKNLNSIWI